jgi:SAM-dependent methyltransferase
VSPLLRADDFAGRAVADIGSGTGRIVQMLLAAGAARVIALEPSAAFDVLRRNTAAAGDRVTCLQARGDELTATDLDYVVSFGVIHHIPDPAPVMRAAFRSLRRGGQALVWLYGKEGNRLYLALVGPLRAVTRRLPHRGLAALSRALAVPLAGYVALCHRAPLPMHAYMTEHLGRLSRDAQVLTIYDQLNPAWARYYTESEARALFADAGFVDIRLNHRHGYSWTVVGTKP